MSWDWDGREGRAFIALDLITVEVYSQLMPRSVQAASGRLAIGTVRRKRCCGSIVYRPQRLALNPRDTVRFGLKAGHKVKIVSSSNRADEWDVAQGTGRAMIGNVVYTETLCPGEAKRHIAPETEVQRPGIGAAA